MKIQYWLVVVALALIERIMRAKFKRTWKAIVLPANVVFSVLSLLFITMFIYSIYDVIFDTILGEVGLYYKKFVCVVVIGIIAAFVGANISIWKRWRTGRKER
jgi:uncharacterized membrane protein